MKRIFKGTVPRRGKALSLFLVLLLILFPCGVHSRAEYGGVWEEKPQGVVRLPSPLRGIIDNLPVKKMGTVRNAVGTRIPLEEPPPGREEAMVLPGKGILPWERQRLRSQSVSLDEAMTSYRYHQDGL